jgi:hypothetical protein
MKTVQNNRQDREMDKLTWALSKADMQAVAIRLDALIKIGNETNLTIVRRVMADLKSATDKIAANLAIETEGAAAE